MTKLEKYIAGIRNVEKRAYARAYLQSLRLKQEANSIIEMTSLSYITAQSVRMRIDELFDEEQKKEE